MIVSTTLPGTLFGAYDPWWEKLDVVLADSSHCPKLREVVFYLDSVGCDAAIEERRLQNIIGGKLPRLDELNLLSVNLRRDLDWSMLL